MSLKIVDDDYNPLRSQLARKQVEELVNFTGGDGYITQSPDDEWLLFYVNGSLVGLTKRSDDLLDDIDRLHDWLCWLFRNYGHILSGDIFPGPRAEA